MPLVSDRSHCQLIDLSLSTDSSSVFDAPGSMTSTSSCRDRLGANRSDDQPEQTSRAARSSWRIADHEITRRSAEGLRNASALEDGTVTLTGRRVSSVKVYRPEVAFVV